MKDISSQRYQKTIIQYRKLMRILSDHQDSDGICRMTKKSIAYHFGLSYTATLKKLDFLKQYGMLISVNDGLSLTGKDVTEATPFVLYPQIIKLVTEQPAVIHNYNEQAKLLNASFGDIQTTWGFISYFYGLKY